MKFYEFFTGGNFRKREKLQKKIIEKLQEVEEVEQINTGKKFKCEFDLLKEQNIKINFFKDPEKIIIISIEFLACGLLIIDERTVE